MRTDREFLAWIHQRLVCIHGENPNYDYMYKLRAIIMATPSDQETPNMGNHLQAVEDLAGDGPDSGYRGDRQSPS